MSSESIARRYARLCNRRGQDAWSILFGYPLARFILIWLQSWRALRPLHITVASLAARSAGAGLLATASHRRGVAMAVALLHLGQVLDSMDGTLARARGLHSALGAFIDKAGDAVALGLLCAAVGWQASRADGDGLWMSAALGGAFFHLLRGYMHWSARALGASAAEPLDGGRAAGERARPLREWLRGFPRLALFGEADLYLWISIGALAGWWSELCIMLLVSQAAAALALAGYHAFRLSGGGGAGGRPAGAP
jgi:phosphatidylglycerophosphate synthase